MSKKKKANGFYADVENNVNDFTSKSTIAPIPVVGEFKEEDELYDPFEHRDKQHASSTMGAATHLIKSSLGSGILAMPCAIKYGGLVVGGIGTLLIGLLCTHTVHILVRTSQIMCRKARQPSMTYAETAEAAFRYGPRPLKKYCRVAGSFVNWVVAATYATGSWTYIVYISRSLKPIADDYMKKEVAIQLYMLCLVPALILLGQVRNLRTLVPCSMIANICLTGGFSIILYYVFTGQMKPMDQLHFVSPSWAALPKFFAIVVFAIEGIGAVLPIENSMANPSRFLGCPSVLNLSMALVVGLYASLGVLGYLKYGDDAETMISLNLPNEEDPAKVAQVLISISVLLTFGLQYYVPLNIIWLAIQNKFSHKYKFIADTVMRIIMVLIGVGAAMLLPDIGIFIGLVGSIFFAFLGLCIPAVLETVSCWESHLGVGYWRLWKNILVFFASMTALIAGSWMSILDIIDYINKHLITNSSD